jgi:hypothetical protein
MVWLNLIKCHHPIFIYPKSEYINTVNQNCLPKYYKSRASKIILIVIIYMGFLTYGLVTTLGVIGFAATGPVAGTIAAGVQSVFYGGAVTSGSWFAIAQSIAMTLPTP